MQATVPWGAKRDLIKGRGWNILSREWMRTCIRKELMSRMSHTDRKFLFSILYLFALWSGRVVPIVGQVTCENIELTRNHPPCVSHVHFVFWRQEGPKVAGREGRGRHCWGLPWVQSTQGAVRNLHKQLITLHFCLKFLQKLMHWQTSVRAAALCDPLKVKRVGLNNVFCPCLVFTCDYVCWDVYAFMYTKTWSDTELEKVIPQEIHPCFLS